MLFKRIKTGSIPKLLLRYLVEILIIFLGITISFLFEQWREERRQKKELIELSESLLTDVDDLKAKLLNDLSGSTDWINQLDSLRIQRISGKISERQLSWFYKMTTGQYAFIFDPYSPTYMSAAENGLIHEFPDSIKHQLHKVYRSELPFFQLLYDQQEDNITNFRNNTMAHASTYLYLTDISNINPDLNILAKEIQQPVYGNFINQVIITEKKVYKMNKDTFDMLTKLQDNLRKYVDRLGNKN